MTALVIIACLVASIGFGYVWSKWGEWRGFESYWRWEGFFWAGAFVVWLGSCYIIVYVLSGEVPWS